jgi:hypothetical protein
MLVVILIFTICRSVIKANHFWLALFLLIFSLPVEIRQYFNLISILGLLIIELLAKYRSGRQIVPPDPAWIYETGETGE